MPLFAISQAILNHSGHFALVAGALERLRRKLLALFCLLISPTRHLRAPQPLRSLVATYLQPFLKRINFNLSCDGLRMESFRPYVCICAHRLISMAKEL